MITVVSIGGALELYCRHAPRFRALNYALLKHFAASDPTNAVFGDSHVLSMSRIPGFSFFGTAGQSPAELHQLVEYLYATTKPGKIILEADPQWFGRYHAKMTDLITAENLISHRIPLLLTSAYFSKSLKSNLLSTFRDAITDFVDSAKADEPVSSVALQQLEQKWSDLFAKPGFNWTWLTEEERLELTKARVESQNPVDHFEDNYLPRIDFESAISFLVARGATLCLFRTPVTATYLQVAEQTGDSNYAAFDLYIHKLAEEKNITYVDFRTLPHSFSDEKFFNADHMTNDEYGEVWPLAAKACFH